MRARGFAGSVQKGIREKRRRTCKSWDFPVKSWDANPGVGQEGKVGPAEGWDRSQEGEKSAKKPEKPLFYCFFFLGLVGVRS